MTICRRHGRTDRTRRRAVAALAAALLLCGTDPAAACGGPDSVCPVEGGHYRMALPPRPDGAPVPGVVYLHGWGANAAATIARKPRRAAVLARGMALIVPQGVPRAGRTQRDWGVSDRGTHPRDDIAFLSRVLADAARRGVDPARILLAGFSRGGSMVWEAACRAPGLARAYAPVSGAFWEPMPEGCAGRVDLHHTHGWSDRVVPIEGRPVAGGRLVQGDLFGSLATLRRTLGCRSNRPARTVTADGLWRRSWVCPGGRLVLALHPGGHGPPQGWLSRALDWFERRLAQARPR